jgi:hypothetical protein
MRTLMTGARLTTFLSVLLLSACELQSPVDVELPPELPTTPVVPPPPAVPKVVGDTMVKVIREGADLYCKVSIKITSPYPIRIHDIRADGIAHGSSDAFLNRYPLQSIASIWGTVMGEAKGVVQVFTTLWSQGHAASITVFYADPTDLLNIYRTMSHNYVCYP